MTAHARTTAPPSRAPTTPPTASSVLVLALPLRRHPSPPAEAARIQRSCVDHALRSLFLLPSVRRPSRGPRISAIESP
jgi:hypothetical protein